ncbi:MAG: magnesium transporter [Rhodoferax sp.]|nr:magnesium transporter [Rhodoferax sp.]MBP9930104.1 magnesium transporter [Rhodoferax sp.]HQX60285.1 magnesium transporter [Burkholderiaceae bacterium]HQZ04412.1 magnesium transporter [Burkholderiaceae bacterium]HRA62117.1 magnesium transporter [Burkholderiaceae bacterium]
MTQPERADSDAARPLTDIAQMVQALAEGRNKRVRKFLARMHPAKTAALLEMLDADQRAALWQQVDPTLEARIQPHLNLLLSGELSGDSGEDSAAEQLEQSDPRRSLRAGEVNHLDAVRKALTAGRLKRVAKTLRRMHPAKVAGLLEALPPDERRSVWSMVDTERAGKVLTYLHDEIRTALAQELDMEDLVASAQHLELDDLVDLIQSLPEQLGSRLMQATSGSRREQLESMLSYPQDSAGGLMNADAIEVRAEVRIGTVLRYLRLLENLPPQTDMLMVVDRQGNYQGSLRLGALVTAEPTRRVLEVMQTDISAIAVDTDSAEVARMFQDLDLLSAPVVDGHNRLIGRITIDDVVDLIRENSDRTMMQMAGLDDEADIFAPVLVSSRRRAVWLGINLLTAFLASWVIGQFQATLSQLVALAVLMPIVASMGGIAGSQTLTLVIRGLALRQVQQGNIRLLLNREVGVSIINGALWAVVIALLAVAWFGDWGIGGVLGAAILINLLCAALAGLAIPLVLDRLGIDPALAGSVILTTVTDVIGFFAFLGLATVLLL